MKFSITPQYPWRMFLPGQVMMMVVRFMAALTREQCEKVLIIPRASSRTGGLSG